MNNSKENYGACVSFQTIGLYLEFLVKEVRFKNVYPWLETAQSETNLSPHGKGITVILISID